MTTKAHDETGDNGARGKRATGKRAGAVQAVTASERETGGRKRSAKADTPSMAVKTRRIAAADDIYLTGDSERAIYNRLSRLEGQVRGVKKMLAERKSCDEMLVQISALKQAVNGVAAELLQAHMTTCVLRRMQAGDGEQALSSLRAALAKVMKHG